jgi:putative PEP-CTERM system TPR-repeat lipoprotein
MSQHRSSGRLGRAIASGLLLALLLGCGDNPDTLVASAKEYISKNDHKAAAIQLKNALQKNPEHAQARFLLGQAEHRNGDLPAAEKELRKAQELGYAADEVVPLLAQVMLELGQAQKVVSEFSQVQLTAPEAKARLLTTLGTAQLVLGKVEIAGKTLDEALAVKADLPAALLAQARLKAIGNDLAGADAMVDNVLAKSPDFPDALLLKAELLTAQGKSEDAVTTYERVLALRPDNIAARGALFSIHMRQKRMDAAGAQLAQLKKLAPGEPRVRYLEAVYAYRQRNLPEAREAIQQVLGIAPNHGPSNLLAGMLELENNSLLKAEIHLQKVLERAPRQLLARRLLTSIYVRTGRADKALDTIKPALEFAQNDPSVLIAAGEAHMAAGSLDKAEEYFEKAAKLDARSTAARTRLGLTRVALGEVSEGFRELETAAELDEKNVQADWALVLAHLRRREADQALKALDNLERKLPASPAPHNLRAAALLLKKDVPAARKSLERALEIEPTFFPAALNLARLDMQDKNVDAAHKRFTDLLQKDPKNVQALLALAQLKRETGGHAKEVQELLERAIVADPSSVPARAALINHHLARNDTKAALNAAQEAQAALPNRADILELVGGAQQAAGEVNQAIATYKKLEAMVPDSPAPLMRLAAAYLAAKDSDGALQAFQKALRMKSDLVDAQRGVIASHLQAGRTREALAAAREVQKQNPRAPVGYMLEGDVHISQKQWGEAEAVFREGLRKSPGAELAIRLHQVLNQEGKGADADKFINGWLKDRPQDLLVREYLAQRAMAGGRHQVAAEHYRAILRSQPNNPVALNNLAWVEGQMKDPKAFEHAEKALSLAPDNPAVLDTMGMLLVGAGKPAQGLELLQKAVDRAPNSHGIRLNYVKALIAAGKKDAARKELEALVALGDKFAGKDEAAALLKSL